MNAGGLATRGLTRAAAATLVSAVLACGPVSPAPPETRADSTIEVLHGVDIADPYRWLEDDDAGDTRAWLAQQAEHAARVMEMAPQTTSRLDEWVRAADVSAPVARAGRYFFSRRVAGTDRSALFMRTDPDAEDVLLVDPSTLGADASVSLLSVSADGTLIAYGLRRGGEDEVVVRFYDVDTAEHLEEQLPRGRYANVSIDHDRTGVYFDALEADGPRVYHRSFGSDEGDELVFGRGYGADVVLYSQLSSNGRYLLVTVSYGAAFDHTELYFRDIWAGNQMYAIVDDVDAAFIGHIAGDTLFILTDWEAPRRRMFAANLRQPTRDSWTEIIPASEAVIETFTAVGGRLIVQRLDRVLPRLTVHEPDGFPIRDIELPGIGAVALDGGGAVTGWGPPTGSWEDDEMSFVFSALDHTPATYRYRVSDGAQEHWLAEPMTEDLTIAQVFVQSADGTSIPMFVAHRPGIERDGNRRTLLTGYGGFNVSVLPRFDPLAAAWIDAGGVWAIANLRGGGEFGEPWHRGGSGADKQNTFDDFIAAAEWLIDNDYTRSDRLAIRGGSNGGLLVGAALTQRPDLFAAVVCTYPLLDMLRYHRFLAGPYWVSEYGSADDVRQFGILHAYSPYQRVEDDVRYPAVMLVSGDADTRVAPLHARKMTARLQAATAGSRPVILHYDERAGHSGGRPSSEVVEELTAQLRFLLWQTDY